MRDSFSFGSTFRAAWSFCVPMVALPAMLALGCADSADDTDTVDDSLQAVESVSQHGALQVVGNQIRDEHGAQVQFKGMSLFWSQWAGQFWNQGAVSTIADSWNANLVRAAMGVEMGGYLQNPEAEKAKVRTVVDAATAKGMYVIIDWHDHNATQHTDQSRAFFTEMARTYGNRPNVLFEIFNEPDNESWGEVKRYAEDIIGAIRSTGANNVVIVGTPTWSQDVDQAANDPITRFQNVAYTLHFYAASHKQSLRDKASYALSKGIALFVTEWGTCDASGNGGLDLNESQTWINFMNEHKLSWANWSLFDKDEAASALRPGSNPNGGWSDGSLTDSGRFVKQKLQEGSSSGGGGGGGGGTTPGGDFKFSVSPNINPWWIEVSVQEPGHSVQRVTANVNGTVYLLPLQPWGNWGGSPPQVVPGGTRVIFTARDEQGREASITSQPWPN